MNKKNNKLALNKQIVANLSNMDDIKGGYNFSMYFIECYVAGKIIDTVIAHLSQQDDRCESRYCSEFCGVNYVSHAKCV